MGEYRQAVGAAEALAVALLAAGVERGELPELTATLDGDGRACVLIGRFRPARPGGGGHPGPAGGAGGAVGQAAGESGRVSGRPGIAGSPDRPARRGLDCSSSEAAAVPRKAGSRNSVSRNSVKTNRR